MRLAAATLPFILFVSLQRPTADNVQEYRSRNGDRVTVRSTSAPETTPEAEIAFYSSREANLLCTLDYSSPDHEHGFGVVKAEWAPDQNYFVFSLTSSGGHQAWHAPTMVYRVRDAEIFSLDAYLTAPISQANFTLKSPNIILTEVQRGEAEPVTLRLDSLGTGRQSRPRSCSSGKRIKASGGLG